MKIHILRAILTLSLFSFNAVAQKKATTEEVKVTIDLNQVKDDKVMVTVTPPKFSSNEVVYHIPKTVPGTYSTDNYGKLIDDLKARLVPGGIIPDEDIIILINHARESRRQGTNVNLRKIFLQSIFLV